MRKKILVRGPALSRSGYGEQTRFALRSLRSYEDLYDIYLITTNWGKTGWLAEETDERRWLESLLQKTVHYTAQKGAFDVSLQVTIPNEWEKLAPVNIGYTAGIETNRIAPVWIEKSVLMDKIIVVSNHAKIGFDETVYEVTNNNTGEKIKDFSCKTSVDVVNYPVRLYEKEDLDLAFETDFNFLAVAQWSVRKNIENTIRWFVEEFKNDKVGLVLKLNTINGCTMDRLATVEKLEQLLKPCEGRKCKIYLIHGDMSDQELTGLYKHPQIKALVSLAHGEGYGLPLFEAAYNGIPVVAPNWSGQCDFLNAPVTNKKGRTKVKPLFAAVEYYMKPIQPSAVWDGVLIKDSMWCYPKERSYKSKLRDVMKDYGRYASQAKKLQSYILENFEEQKIYDNFVSSVNDAVGLEDEFDIEDISFDDMTIKDKTKKIKKVLGRLENQPEKVDFLKDKYKGQKCYIISCGPTLLDHDHSSLKTLLRDNLVISVKQAYDMFSEETDFHIYNCANYKTYDYGQNTPIIVEATSMPQVLGPCDFKFPIPERRFEQSLSKTKEFSEWTFSKKPLVRPYGPGIMYEAVFYLAEHLGVSEIITIGWDNKLNEDKKHHFYDLMDVDKKNFIHFNEVDENPAAVASLPEEAQMTVNVMGDWSQWLKSREIDLKIVSSTNPAPESIPRLDLNSLLDFVEVL